MSITVSNRVASRSRRGNNSIADGIKNQVGNGVKVQLMHDVGAMGLGRLHRHIQSRRNFSCTLPRSQQVYDLAFASR